MFTNKLYSLSRKSSRFILNNQQQSKLVTSKSDLSKSNNTFQQQRTFIGLKSNINIQEQQQQFFSKTFQTKTILNASWSLFFVDQLRFFGKSVPEGKRFVNLTSGDAVEFRYDRQSLSQLSLLGYVLTMIRPGTATTPDQIQVMNLLEKIAPMSKLMNQSEFEKYQNAVNIYEAAFEIAEVLGENTQAGLSAFHLGHSYNTLQNEERAKEWFKKGAQYDHGASMFEYATTILKHSGPPPAQRSQQTEEQALAIEFLEKVARMPLISPHEYRNQTSAQKQYKARQDAQSPTQQQKPTNTNPIPDVFTYTSIVQAKFTYAMWLLDVEVMSSETQKQIAEQLLIESATIGEHLRSRFWLGVFYERQGKHPEAFKMYKLASESDKRTLMEAREMEEYALACSNLGVMLLGYANGVKQDISEANRLFKISADMGNTPPKLFYGINRVQGTGVAQNVEEGLTYIKGALLTPDGKDIVRYEEEFGELSKLAWPIGQTILATSLVEHEENIGKPESFDLAMKLLKNASDQGNKEAETLYCVYQLSAKPNETKNSDIASKLSKLIVDHDDKHPELESPELLSANSLYSNSAFNQSPLSAKPTTQSDSSVQSNNQQTQQQRAFGDPLRATSYALLAECYARGSHGLEKDEKIAMAWARKSVALESGSGYNVLGILLLNQGQSQEAYEAWVRGGDLQNPACLFNLARLFNEGIGVDKNAKLAASYTKQAEDIMKRKKIT